MERLKSKSLKIEDTTIQKPSSEYLCVSYLNIRSLRKHYEDLMSDQTVQNSHIICLLETKVTDYAMFLIKEMNCQSVNTKHGLTIYYNSLLHAEQIHLSGRLSPI